MSWREDLAVGKLRVEELYLGTENAGLGVQMTATAVEINQMADPEARVEEITETGPVTAGVGSVELNHTSVAIIATIADAVNHQGLFVVKATTEPGGFNDHTLQLTSGTFDGVNNIAVFADINDALVVYFDSNGNGTLILNEGSVALSTP